MQSGYEEAEEEEEEEEEASSPLRMYFSFILSLVRSFFIFGERVAPLWQYGGASRSGLYLQKSTAAPSQQIVR